MEEEKEALTQNEISYETAVERYGNGRYQIFLYILLVIVTWSTASGNESYVWIAAKMDYTCITPTADTNSSDVSNITFQVAQDQCSYSKVTSYANGTSIADEEVRCTEWSYDQTYFHSSIRSEWNLNGCYEQQWQIPLVGSFYMIGFLTGCFLFGDLSDRFGRRTMFLVSSLGLVASGVASAYSVNLPMLIVMKFLNGNFVAGARNSAFVYLAEILTAKWRSFTGPSTGFTYWLSDLLLVPMAQTLPGWRILLLVAALICIIYIPYFWILHESPHWLLAQNRHDEVIAYFKRSAQVNGVELPSDLRIYHPEEHHKSKVRYLDFFRTPRTRLVTCIVCFGWFVVGAVMFGFTYNVGYMTGNIFTNMYITLAFGPMDLLAMWVSTCGRKRLIVGAFCMMTILGFTLVGLVQFEHIPVIAGIAMPIICGLGRSLASNGFSGLYVITSELYATKMRVTALGLGSSFARVGGAVAPYIAQSSDIARYLPYVFFGILSVTAGAVAIVLPETLRKELPVTTEEMEEFIAQGMPFCKPRAKPDVELEDLQSAET